MQVKVMDEAENARLTEQVAQLTAERDELKVCLDISRGCRKVAEAENARLTEALADAKENLRAANIAYDRLERDRDAANALLVRVLRCSDPDEEIPFEDIQDHLPSQPAAPVPVTTCLDCGMVGNACYAHLHVCQPAVPTRTETPELRPGCTRADYYEPTRTESNYSLAELRRIIRAEPGSLTGAELVVRDAMLEMCTSRAGAELTALRRRVARATAALTRNHVARALDALRGR